MENTKLTLVTFTARGKQVSAFVQAKILNNGKVIVSNNLVDKLFLKYWGFTLQRGEKFRIG